MSLLVHNLRTEYKKNPLGLGSIRPRLCWEIISSERNVIQTAYQIIAKTDEKIIWNSNKVDSDQSVRIEYNGQALQSGQRVYWKVKVWDNQGNESDWSDTAYWEMGLMQSNDWKAFWIEPNIKEDISISTPCPFLRKEFTADNKIQRAQLYVTAHGLYQVNINGQKVSDELFTPGWTSYKQRLQYQAFDVTEHIRKGKNAIGVIIGDGWYRGYLVWQGEKNLYGDKTALLLQLKLTYEDGSEELICSDKSWKSSTGPILQSDIYNGEIYDALLEKPGWDSPDFNDQQWNGVNVKDISKTNLVSPDGPPVRITETIKPIKKIITPKGEVVFDLGQNIVGWVKFSLKGDKGDKITLHHAEVLDQKGNFYTENLRAAKAEDTYLFKGEGKETYEPHFTFHGFRYIRVSEYPGEVTINDIEGRVVHSDMTPIGNFECSDPLVNRLQKNIQWGLRGNFLDIPTDCPQRDERLGWTGDAQVFASTACFNMDADSFYAKWMKDFIVDQREDGSVPWVVPMAIKDGGGTGWSDGYGATGWADAAVVIPWVVYQAYDDKRILETQYGSMKLWVEYMRKHAGDRHIFDCGFHFGDWLSFAEYYSYYYNAPDYGYAGAHTEKDLIATAYYYYSTSLLQKTATILGKEQDAKDYEQLLPKIKSAFQKEFITQTGRLISNTQTAYSLTLSFGLIPDEFKEIAAKRLADDVKHFGHLTTGFLGTPLLCDALTENGYPDLAFMLLFNKRYPSWLYPVTKGATTIWERWDCIKPDGSFQTAGMNSFNHYAYGAVGNWLYTKVAGLSIDENNPGYKKIIIKPHLTDHLTYAKAEYDSVYGHIKSHWIKEGSQLSLHVVIPPNTSAIVYIPVNDVEKISENGFKLDKHSDIQIIGTEKDRVIIDIGSGEYNFSVNT
ncbi:MAG: glycoside hydrolase family 78 protein [Bacteroidales bacterium]|nr:glycoside hydrolase family 78 protein [Bacteroidales bacterium]